MHQCRWRSSKKYLLELETTIFLPTAIIPNSLHRQKSMRTTVFSTPIITPILRVISIFLLKIMGWKARGKELEHQRFVLIGAPHTSNWDFPLMLMVVLKLRLRVYWMGKHTLFMFPFGGLMKWLGGIPIDRSSSHNVVSETVRQYRENEELCLLYTSPSPRDRTRSRMPSSA